MRKMNRFWGLALTAAAMLSLALPAHAADYSFTTTAPQDYYGDTSYEEVYGSQYNYGGPNVVDFLDPLAEGAPAASSAGSLEYGLSDGSGGLYADSTGSGFPVEWMESPASAITATPSVSTTTSFTDAGGMTRSDGSIGTLVIPSLGIRYKAYEGTDSATMHKGVGHFPSTSAWNGNIGLCGHNRGSRHSIGSIKDLKVGDTIQYETSSGTRTYSVSYVGTIEWTDWSYLNATRDNRITIITCLADQPTKRVCVQATETYS